MVAMRVRMCVLAMTYDWTIDVAAISVVLSVIMVVTVFAGMLMRMAMHRAIGMNMFVTVLIFVHGAIDTRFPGAATASRTHGVTSRILNPNRLPVP
jgi:hypothetical protein